MKLGIIGVGLIGGSFALGLKQSVAGLEVLGVDKNADNLFQALELGIIDRLLDLNSLCNEADVIVISIPVDAIKASLSDILDRVGRDQLVVDFGSTKKAICDAVRYHSKRKHFLAAHPIAGTEYSGPESAFADLFQKRVMITCEEELSGKVQLELFRKLCSYLNMRIRSMTSQAHDLHLAYVSHLSHITSFALGNTVLDKKDTETHIFDMAGSGFASTVRLAKSSPQMWAPIFEENKEHLLDGLSNYIEHLKVFKESLENGDNEALIAFMKKANHIKDILDLLP